MPTGGLPSTCRAPASIAWRQRGPSERDQANATLGEEIGALLARSRRTYGSPRLHRALRRAGHACGRHRVARLMRARGLAGRVRGRRRPWTTDSDHEQPIAPNRLGRREVPVERPNEAWAADITDVPTQEGWLYLAGVLDLGSRRVVGWAMGESLETSLPMDALRMALGPRQPKAGLLHHSDRGCQYASEAYREHLAAWGVNPSMSRKGNCYDNAAMESFWSTLKERRLSIDALSPAGPRRRARSSTTSKPSTTASGSTAPSAIYLLWNLKNKST